jgi:hypothetical protein
LPTWATLSQYFNVFKTVHDTPVCYTGLIVMPSFTTMQFVF